MPPPLYVKPLNIPQRRPSTNNYNFSQPIRPSTQASSVYSAQPSTAHLSNTSSMINRPRKSYRQYHPYRTERVSNGSLTSFESLDSAYDDQPRTGVSGELSPVVESPVSYPRIPNSGRLPKDTIRLVPPPPQPDFTTAVQRERSQREKEKPWEMAEQNAARQRRNSLNREPSNHTRERRGSLIREPLNSTRERTVNLSREPSNAVYNSLWNDPRYQRPNPNLPFAPQTSPFEEVRTSTTPSLASSTASSLLAKRLGSKAPPLTLGGPNDKKKEKWRVVKGEDVQIAKSPGWTPRTGRDSRGYGELPKTPGWKPRLTPTRRGEDLYLSVQ